MSEEIAELLERMGQWRAEILDVMRYLERKENEYVGTKVGSYAVLERKEKVRLGSYEHVWMPVFECACINCGAVDNLSAEELRAVVPPWCPECVKVEDAL